MPSNVKAQVAEAQDKIAKPIPTAAPIMPTMLATSRLLARPMTNHNSA